MGKLEGIGKQMEEVEARWKPRRRAATRTRR